VSAETAAAAPSEEAATLLTAEDLAVGYGGAPVLTEVCFAAGPGERVAVLGPNGGGKTTLLRAILGELASAHGSLTVGGRCAVVPQTERSRLDFPVSALDVALMGTVARLPWWRRPGRRERSAAAAALGRVGLADRARTTFGDLSAGQRQRVLVARALVQEAPIVLLDEPFAGLDAASAEQLEQLLAVLAGEGRLLLVATHDVEQARGWDRVLCLNGRQVAWGAPGPTLTRPVLEATYGAELVDVDCPQHGHERAILPPHHH